MIAWPVFSLSDVCDISIGRTPSRNRRDYWEGDHPWAAIADLNQGRFLKSTKEKITDAAVQDCNCRLIPAGTVLISFKLSIGKVSICSIGTFTNEAIAALIIRDRKDVDPNFLSWALRSLDLTAGLDRAAKGLTLNKAKLGEIQLPLPPLPEQRRIAAILDEADALRAKRWAALAQLDEMAQAIFVEMFGDPVTNDHSFPSRSLDVLGRVSTGNTPPSDREGMFGGCVPFITPGDLGSELPVKRTLTEEGAAASRTVRRGATLVCCIGATIGKMGKAQAASAFNQQINAVEWSDAVDDDYGFTAMTFFKRHIAEWGASTTLPILKKSSFQKIEIPVPPRSEQTSFSRRAAAIRSAIELNRRQGCEFESLFSSLQHRAFRGEL